MRVVTLNTWKNEGDYAARLVAMADGLTAFEADAIALQECFVCNATGLDTAAALAQALGMSVLRQQMRAKPRLHDGVHVASRSDLAILTRRPVRSLGYAAFPADPRDGDRGLLWADLDFGRATIRFGCAHLTHLRDTAGAAMRKVQAEAARRHLLAGWTGPALLLGDFNATAGDESLDQLFAEPSLDGASLSAIAGTREIDHVLLFQAGSACAFVDRRVCMKPDRINLGAGPSDHPAIVVELATP